MKIFNKYKIDSTAFLYWVVSAVILVFFAWQYIGHDLYWDEIMSLHYFTFKDLGDTLFSDNYRPNNHIFFNLCNNVFRQGLGLENWYASLDKIWMLRLCQIPIALLTLWGMFALGKRFFNKETAILTSVLLISTLPFLNFITQLRGYNFTLLFVVGILYFSFLYIAERKNISLLISAICLYLLLYTIPSNAYFAIPFVLFWGMYWVYAFVQERSKQSDLQHPTLSNALFKMLMAYVVVALCVYWTYLPFLDRIVSDQFISRTANSRFYIWTDFFPRIVQHFVSARYLVLLLSLVGLYFFIRTKSNKQERFYWLILLFVFVGSFATPFLRNDLPQERYLLFGLPLFVLLLAVPLGSLLRQLKQPSSSILLFVVYVYCMLTLGWQYQSVQSQLVNNVEKEKRVVGLYANFYQSPNFRPSDIVDFIQTQALDTDIPLLMMPYELDMIAAAQYLKTTDMDIYLPKRIKNTEKGNEMILLYINPKAPQYLKKHIAYPIEVDQYRGKSKMSILLDYMNHQQASTQYYLLSSFGKRLERLYTQHYKMGYELDKLTNDQNDFQLYLLTKRLPLVNNEKNTQ